MAQCKFCNSSIDWITTAGRKIPVDNTVNILPAKHGTTTGITSTGHIVKGFIVGDAHEGGYLMCYIKHKCE